MAEIRRSFHIIFGIISMLTVRPLCSQACTDKQVADCVRPMMKFDFENKATIIPTYDEPTIKDICNTYDEVEICLKPFRYQCDVLDQLFYVGLEQSYYFICYQALEEYLSFRDCLIQPDLHIDGGKCNETLESSLSGIDPNVSGSYRRDRVCQYANTYIDCVYNSVRSYCGQEAAQWQRNLDERILGPLLGVIKCSFYKTYDRTPYPPEPVPGSKVNNTVVIIISVVVVLIVLTGSLAALLAIKTYKERKRLEQRRQRRRERRNQNSGDHQASVHRSPLDQNAGLPPLSAAYTPEQATGGTMEQPPPYIEKESPPPGYSTNDMAAGISYDNNSNTGYVMPYKYGSDEDGLPTHPANDPEFSMPFKPGPDLDDLPPGTTGDMVYLNYYN